MLLCICTGGEKKEEEEEGEEEEEEEEEEEGREDIQVQVHILTITNIHSC